MDVSEIVDRNSFEAWLEALPEDGRQEAALALATRAALRVFPFWAAGMPSDWGRRRGFTVLPVVRSVVIAEVAVAKAPPKLFSFALSASQNSLQALVDSQMYSKTASIAAASANSAAYAVAYEDFIAIGSASEAVGPYTRDADLAASDAYWNMLWSDCKGILSESDILRYPVWQDGLEPEGTTDAWAKGLAWMETAPGHAFWIRWYEAILAGRPLTQDWDSHWNLMHDIALIPDEDWGEGKEQDAIRVAGIIDLITQKHALQQEVARAKRALENETYNAMTLGQHRDNLPDDMPSSRIVEYRAALKELQAELDAVEEALEPPVPDAEVLEQATGRLRAVWEKVRKAIIALVAAYALGAAGYLGSVHIESLQTLIAEKLPGFVQSLKNVGSKPSALPTEQSSWGNSPLDL